MYILLSELVVDAINSILVNTAVTVELNYFHFSRSLSLSLSFSFSFSLVLFLFVFFFFLPFNFSFFPLLMLLLLLADDLIIVHFLTRNNLYCVKIIFLFFSAHKQQEIYIRFLKMELRATPKFYFWKEPDLFFFFFSKFFFNFFFYQYRTIFKEGRKLHCERLFS